LGTRTGIVLTAHPTPNFGGAPRRMTDIALNDGADNRDRHPASV
jgi:hypothetical protein